MCFFHLFRASYVYIYIYIYIHVYVLFVLLRWPSAPCTSSPPAGGAASPHIIYIYIYISISIYLSLSLSIYIYIYLYLCIYIYVYIYIYIYIYIQLLQPQVPPLRGAAEDAHDALDVDVLFFLC